MATEFLRHTLSALGYRAAKAVRDAGEDFGLFRVRSGTRTPVEILAHMGDLMDWALSIARGAEAWRDSSPLPWEQEKARFFAALQAFDDFLAAAPAVSAPPEKLFQGPVADALTHTGQLTMLRRLADSPVRGDNYFRARIELGRAGERQAPPVREFGD